MPLKTVVNLMEQLKTQNEYWKWLKLILFLQLLIVPSVILSEASEADGIKYTFNKKKNGYSFQFQTSYDADPECLLAVVFEYDHLRKFTKNIDTIQLVKNEGDRNIVRYGYDKFLFKHKSTYLRILSKDNNTITFELVENELHKSIFPKLIATKGYYKIKTNDQKTIIEYFQEAVIEDKNINSIYLYFVKNEILAFARDLQKYAQHVCSL